MKLLKAEAIFTASNVNRQATRATQQMTVESAMESIIFKYDKRLGPVGFTFKQNSIPVGYDIYYKINNSNTKLTLPDVTAFTGDFLFISPSSNSYIDLSAEPDVGTVELFIGLGLTKELFLKGAGITEIETFGKYDIPALSRVSCSNLTNLRLVPATIPTYWTSMEELFNGCINLNSPNVSLYDTSRIITMVRTFVNCSSFNQPLPWNVRALRYADSMLENAYAFAQNLSGWCVPLILSAPTNFALGTPIVNNTGFLPIWGTCPLKDTVRLPASSISASYQTYTGFDFVNHSGSLPFSGVWTSVGGKPIVFDGVVLRVAFKTFSNTDWDPPITNIKIGFLNLSDPELDKYSSCDVTIEVQGSGNLHNFRINRIGTGNWLYTTGNSPYIYGAIVKTCTDLWRFMYANRGGNCMVTCTFNQ